MTANPLARRASAVVAVALAAGLVWLGCGQDRSDITGPGPNPQLLRQAIHDAIAVQNQHTPELLAEPEVVGTGVGLSESGEPEIHVYTTGPVAHKLPTRLDGFPVRAEVTGMFLARTDLTARQPRPVPTGVSVGHPDVTAGTIGARVKDALGNVYILSNNHVLANQNQANLGDPILQPGAYDGGTAPNDVIGNLDSFVWLDFSGANNQVDAAIATTTTALTSNSTPTDDCYGAPSSTTVPAYLGQNVQKCGRTTKLTHGQVSDVNMTVNVCYAVFYNLCVKSAKFVGQIGISGNGFSGGGDSGSLIVTDDANKNPVGLLFAGSQTMTIANPIDKVLANFGVSVDGGPSTPPTPLTDLAVTSVDAPASVIQGDPTDVQVTVKNVGNQDVGSDIGVTLTDETDAAAVGTQTINGLAAGASATLTFSWNTGAASIGDHTLTATQGQADDNGDNDSASTTVSVMSTPPPASYSHVGDIDGSAVWRNRRRWTASATVLVHDSNHNPVAGATVSGVWDFGNLGSTSCTTGSNGRCTVSLTRLRQQDIGVFFTVTGISHPTLTYDSGANHDPDGDSDGTVITIWQP